MGFTSCCLSLFLYIMSSYLMSYSVLYELNTLDAGMSQSMCGVIVMHTGAGLLDMDVMPILHSHCLGYRHNFALFYQLIDTNLFTHRIICLHERSL